MQTVHVVMILACDQHAETTRGMLDEAQVGNWVVMSGEQARRVGHLQYTPLWPSTSSRVIFGFAERAVIEKLIRGMQREYFEKGGMNELSYHIKTKKFGDLIRNINRQLPLLKEELKRI